MVNIASDLGTNPNSLMAVMSFETGESFDPEVIFFNDPLTIQEGLTRRAAGHHNHPHVRFN